MKDPRLAFFYSILVPGLGHLCLGERAKGWTLLCMTAGVWVSLIISHTPISWLLMGGVYLGIVIPAALDAFRTASGQPRVFAGNSVFYVVIMLLMVGPFAIPLLWQSPKFSTAAKVLWTIAVIAIALFAIATLAATASLFDQLLKQSPTF